MKLISKESKNTFVSKDGMTHFYHNFYIVCDNGKSIQIKCAFKTDIDKLNVLANTGLDVRVIKKQSAQTYKNKNGKECHYYNYFLVTSTEKYIQIRCSYDEYDRLDMIAFFEGR